jgi:hypothetical protein
VILMTETIGNRVRSVDIGDLTRWFDRANEPWNPITAAERQLAALIDNTETAPSLAAYDHLQDMASQAVRWLELNSCPDTEIGRRLRIQMMGYRIVAETVRRTPVAKSGAQPVDLRELIDQQTSQWAYDKPRQKSPEISREGRRAP